MLDKDDMDDLVLYVIGYAKVLLERDIKCEYSEELPEECGAFAHRGIGFHMKTPYGRRFVKTNP